MYLRRESARKPAFTFRAYPVYPGIFVKLRGRPLRLVFPRGEKYMGNKQRLRHAVSR